MKRGGPGFVLDREVVVARDLGSVFRFFADPANLNLLTPPWLAFQIVGVSTPEIREDTLIDYQLELRGLPIRWRSRITEWDPPHGFADEQLRGPYRSWFHRHRFEAIGDRTRCRDEVEYSVLGGALVDKLLVRPDLERIFDYRAAQLTRIFGA